MFDSRISRSLVARSFVFSMLLVASATLAFSQNLVRNAGFDNDLSDWSAGEGTELEIVHRTDIGSTLVGGSGPGAMESRNFFFNGGSSGPRQWVQGIVSGTTYTVAASFYIPSEDNVADGFSISIDWYDDESHYIDDAWVSGGPLVLDTWVRVSDDIVAPNLATQALLRVFHSAPILPDETGPSVAIHDDVWLAVKGAEAAVQALFVPAAASATGQGGTFWSTTAWISNEIDFPVTISGAFLAQNQDNSGVLGSLTELGTIPALGFVEIKDMVGHLGLSQVTGGLYLEASVKAGGIPAVFVKGTTHTFTPNPSGGGEYGQGLPAVGPGTLNRAVIPGLFQGPEKRTNLGILNTSDQTLTVDVQIRDSDGQEQVSLKWTLPPFAQRQVSLPSMGVATLDGGVVVITRTSTAGSFRAYTSTVDQISGDAVYNAGQ